MHMLSAGLLLAMVAAPALAQTTPAPDDLVNTARADMAAPDGTRLGTVTLTSTPASVILAGTLRGLPPGPHGFHVHETGACEPPFESAGGHFNPGGAEHGFLTEGGPHAGDMTNVTVGDDGVVAVEILDTFLTLDRTLFDEDGAALVIHAGPDDYRTQPSGHSGDRIACGVILPD
jgi:Cu-Zn family superoxide dismutase